MSIPAGLAEMPPGRFLLLTAAASAIWTAGLMTGGYLLDAKYDLVAAWIDPISTTIPGLVVLGYLSQVLRPRRST